MAKVKDALNRIYNGLVGIGYSSIPPSSVLRKNYWNIYNSLNRNIGQVDYNQHINFNGTDVNIGDVLTVDYATDVDLSYQFLNKDRLTKLKNGNYEYYNYYDYAEHELNHSIGRGMSPISIGDNTFMFKRNMLSYNNYSKIDTKKITNLDTENTLDRESAFYNYAMEYFYLENGDNRYSLKFNIDIDNANMSSMYNSVSNNYSSEFNSTFANNIQKVYQDTQSDQELKTSDIPIGVSNVTFNKFSTSDLTSDDLIAKTNQLFKYGKIKSLLGKFHTDENDLDKNDVTSTAYSKYGLSHGKNLLKNKSNRDNAINGYNDPYCRVWTYHKQYSKNTDLIRPFSEEGTSGLTSYLNEKARSENGHTRLTEKSVLRENGYVNITPKKDDPTASIKQCMFSIENLAWKGSYKGEDDLFTTNLSKEQRGPLGGRIMWFPPYDLEFSESVSSPWNSTQFIGRGEPIYTYTNTERIGTLSFKVLIDHPSLINYFDKNNIDVSKDEQSDSEHDLLRFFNGCDVPSLQTQTISETQSVPMTQEIEIATDAVTQDLIFMIYYPNNYSGINDLDTNIDPITYILNGCGTNRIDNINATDETAVSYINDDILRGYEMVNPLDSFMDEIKPYNEYDVVDEVLQSGTKYKTLLPIPNSTYKDINHNWWYRVDSAYTGQNLRGMMQNDGEYSQNYFDTTSYHLNVDLSGVESFENYKDLYGINYDTAWLCSFAEFYVAMKEKQNVDTPLVRAIKANMSNESLERIDIIKYMFDGVLLEVQSVGFASNEGKTELNTTLAGNRSKTIGTWLQKNKVANLFNLGGEKSVDVNYITEDFGTEADNFTNQDINSIESKMVKCAKVVFKIRTDRFEKITTAKEGLTRSTAKVLEDLRQHIYDAKKKIISSYTVNTEKIVSEYDNKRYDNEYEFFERINKEDTFLRHKIIDKIKYFDPAFHSVSPEGFNARLTFLHQCTRQGPTISNSDIHGGSTTAYNMAFGRPPVCVLRIGDFYNTKIVIDSLSISYDNSPWDLNPEGVGVQPMIAKVTMSFKFLGGSDLGGPIGRLQNALSFNFYANTSVYDNRAEQIEYVGNENGDIKSYTAVNPLINKPKVKVK